MKYILWGNILLVPTTLKCAKQFKIKLQESHCGKNRFYRSSLGKGGPVTRRTQLNQGDKKFTKTRLPGGSKIVILCFLENMRYLKRDGNCSRHIRWQIYNDTSVYLQVQKIQSINTKNQSINRLYDCQDGMGEGGKKFFSLNFQIQVQELETSQVQVSIFPITVNQRTGVPYSTLWFVGDRESNTKGPSNKFFSISYIWFGMESKANLIPKRFSLPRTPGLLWKARQI